MKQTAATDSNSAVSSPGNHALWLGPLLTVVGIGSYFVWFTRFPTLRDFPWTSLLIMFGGIIVAAVGIRRAYNRQMDYRGKMTAPLSLLFSMFLTVGFSYLLFYHTSHIPAPTEATLQLQVAPDFELVNQEGEAVQLSDFKGRRVVLDFYRGHW